MSTKVVWNQNITLDPRVFSRGLGMTRESTVMMTARFNRIAIVQSDEICVNEMPKVQTFDWK